MAFFDWYTRVKNLVYSHFKLKDLGVFKYLVSKLLSHLQVFIFLNDITLNNFLKIQCFWLQNQHIFPWIPSIL